MSPEMGAAGYSSRMIPLFAVPGPDGRAGPRRRIGRTDLDILDSQRTGTRIGTDINRTGCTNVRDGNSKGADHIAGCWYIDPARITRPGHNLGF